MTNFQKVGVFLFLVFSLHIYKNRNSEEDAQQEVKKEEIINSINGEWVPETTAEIVMTKLKYPSLDEVNKKKDDKDRIIFSGMARYGCSEEPNLVAHAAYDKGYQSVNVGEHSVDIVFSDKSTLYASCMKTGYFMIIASTHSESAAF